MHIFAWCGSLPTVDKAVLWRNVILESGASGAGQGSWLADFPRYFQDQICRVGTNWSEAAHGNSIQRGTGRLSHYLWGR